MNWLTWQPLYQEVATDLGLSIPKDYTIAEKYKILVNQSHKNGFTSILEKIYSLKKEKSWIFGAGPSLEQDFTIFQDNYSPEHDLVVGVDGACLFLLEKEIYPDIIFSDGDGSLEALLTCIQHGSMIVLHAHGDNFTIISDFFPKVQNYTVLPTVQTEPYEPYLYNFGGFTDGDRAISAILEWFKQITILLLGFTFGKIQGRYSKPNKLKEDAEASEFKQKKLTFAKRYIAILAKIYPNQIFNLSKPTDEIPGVLESFF